MQPTTTWTFKKSEPLYLARQFADVEGTALLNSDGKSSYLTLFPDKKVSVQAKPGCWDRLEEQLGPFDETSPLPKCVGYLGYEMGCFADFDKEISYFPSATPDALFYRPTVVIHFDHLTHLATLYAEREVSLEQDHSIQKTELKLGYRSDTLQSYLEKIGQIKEWILAGEIYQVNLSQEFHLEGQSDPFTLFETVCALNPAPFSAFVQCDDFALVSSSPERFLTRNGNRLETRPIKGTMPRGKTPQEDRDNQRALLASEKERAELLMITDLMRSDLGRVSEPGSVVTEEIFQCERYTNVFHLLSRIHSRSLKSAPLSLIRKLFPGGSITGCPKIRAMEKIALLEKRPRGVYTGSIGYLAGNGDFDFNIAIRTLVAHRTFVQIQLGGGIVIDSDPVKEFEETLHKGVSLFEVLGADAFCLL